VAPRAASAPSTASPPASTVAPTTTTTIITTTTTLPKTTTTTTTTPKTTSPAQARPAVIALSSRDVTTYNPYGAAASSFGRPGNAVGSGAWTYQLDPNNPGNVLVGLLIHLPSLHVVDSISLETDTPGMGVEFYGTTAAPPISISSSKWIPLSSRSSIDQSAAVGVNVHKAFANLLVWITTAPPNTTVGTITVAKLSVTG
jgi:hypothetical protein